MTHDRTRRDFLKDTALLTAAMTAMRAANPTQAGEAALPEMPKIKLGNLEVSRLILGSNPFFGYAHQPGDIGKQMSEYYTDERIMDILAQAAEVGITTVTAPPDARWIKLYNNYLDKGGKIRIWIAQAHSGPKTIPAEITAAVKGGAKACFVQGHRTEDTIAAGKIDQVRGWVEHIKSLGIPAGLAAHRPTVHPAAEKAGFPTDFYFQAFFIPDTYLKEDRDKAIKTIRQMTKPVIGYKILAAGRLPAKEGFTFAFEKLAKKDGVCVGVFPKTKTDMVAEDARLVRKLGA